MFDIYEENIKNCKQHSKTIPDKRKHDESNDFLITNSDINEVNSFRSESPSSFINPPSPTSFFQHFPFKSFPRIDYLINKQTIIKNKSCRFLKVCNNLNNKITLLEEIYDSPEYKRSKVINKSTQCNLDQEAPYRQLAKLVSLLNKDNTSFCDRTVHPAYSNEDREEEMTMDSSGLFKVPLTPPLFTSDSQIDDSDHMASAQVNQSVTEPDSLFLEHDGSTYIRVDDTNYHLVQSFSEDGIVITETGLQIVIPEGTEIPMNSFPTNQQTFQQNEYMEGEQFETSIQNNQRNDPYFGHVNNYYRQGNNNSDHSNTVKLYSDYVALPLRPAPQTPFTLSSQLYTPELSISLTEQECELMLTIDSQKKALPQQQPVYYQIHSYKDEDRYAKPSSEVWGLVGEIKSCPLPMFCTISIPTGFHKHYFAIRSVDEFSRFSDWSNVVQVEVENNNVQHLQSVHR